MQKTPLLIESVPFKKCCFGYFLGHVGVHQFPRNIQDVLTLVLFMGGLQPAAKAVSSDIELVLDNRMACASLSGKNGRVGGDSLTLFLALADVAGCGS